MRNPRCVLADLYPIVGQNLIEIDLVVSAVIRYRRLGIQPAGHVFPARGASVGVAEPRRSVALAAAGPGQTSVVAPVSYTHLTLPTILRV